MCGIFAYLNHRVPRQRREVLTTLINGLKRLEYRGYDSAGVAVDSDQQTANGGASFAVIKRSGKVASLAAAAMEQVSNSPDQAVGGGGRRGPLLLGL